MSSYKIILEISKTLRDTLWIGFRDDDALKQHVPAAESIVLVNPADAARDNNRRLSLWLYQVQENEFLRNQSPLRVPSQDDLIQFPPLALNLFYLLTPSTNSVEGDLMVLGRSLQIFYDNPTLVLKSSEEPGTAEELRISMCQRDLRELAEVWEALQQPYHLSVCYEIRLTRIDSQRSERVGRVRDRSLDFATGVGTST